MNRQVLERLAAILASVRRRVAAMTPISGAAGRRFISVPGFAENPDDRRRASMNLVGPKYFETLGTPFIAGRDFAFADDGRPGVAIVNQAMARYYFGASSPLGRQFTIEGQTTPLEIVGVVGDAKYLDLHETPPRTIYTPCVSGRCRRELDVRAPHRCPADVGCCQRAARRARRAAERAGGESHDAGRAGGCVHSARALDCDVVRALRRGGGDCSSRSGCMDCWRTP